jgi:hypothetical protein
LQFDSPPLPVFDRHLHPGLGVAPRVSLGPARPG